MIGIFVIIICDVFGFFDFKVVWVKGYNFVMSLNMECLFLSENRISLLLFGVFDLGLYMCIVLSFGG